MKIKQRIAGGWTSRENKQPELCDVCGNRLWIDPGGGIYCDHIHETVDTLNSFFGFATK
jgi:hypothetical protein